MARLMIKLIKWSDWVKNVNGYIFLLKVHDGVVKSLIIVISEGLSGVSYHKVALQMKLEWQKMIKLSLKLR